MPRKGANVSPEAKARNAAATARWHTENTEVIKFSIRVKKGCSGAYRELAQKRGQSLASIIKTYLDGECRSEGIDV